MTAFLTTESLSLSNPELFTLQACAVAKPWGRERYDFILDFGHHFWRVQGGWPIQSLP